MLRFRKYITEEKERHCKGCGKLLKKGEGIQPWKGTFFCDDDCFKDLKDAHTDRD